jgi:hypothetical protein
VNKNELKSLIKQTYHHIFAVRLKKSSSWINQVVDKIIRIVSEKNLLDNLWPLPLHSQNKWDGKKVPKDL